VVSGHNVCACVCLCARVCACTACVCVCAKKDNVLLKKIVFSLFFYGVLLLLHVFPIEFFYMGIICVKGGITPTHPLFHINYMTKLGKSKTMK
jgi:hypothetical protein